jgi:hypothetical protein
LQESVDAHQVTRALLSVYDKTGIVDFARELAQRGSSSCRRAARPASPTPAFR